MIDFVADFESSKIINYLETEKDKIFDEDGNFLPGRAAYRYVEEEDENGEVIGKLVPDIFRYKKVDIENSKTWVYHWAIEQLDLTDFMEGYDIDSFMKYIEFYQDDMKIYFHNEKFDGSFILFYMIQRPNEYKQLIEAKNEKTLKEKFKSENRMVISATLMDSFKDYGKPNIEKYDPLRFFRKRKVIKRKNGVDYSLIDGIYFTHSVNNMGVMYSIKIFYLKKDMPVHIVEIVDSLKLLNFSVRQLGKDFLNIKLPKLKIDYDIVRPEKRPDLLTEKDHAYIKRDIDIVAKCLSILKTSPDIEGSKNKNTIASLALDDFKTLWARKVLNVEWPTIQEKERVFRETFPAFKTELYDGVFFNEYDEFVRSSYKGGFCYVYKINKTTDNDKGINYSDKGMCVLDVNSLFPFIMLSRPMPYGMPITVKGEPLFKNGYLDIQHLEDGTEIKELYDYYFIHLKVKFKLKENHIPSIMLKGRDIDRNSWPKVDENGNVIRNKKGEIEMESLPPNEYLENSDGRFLDLFMTKDDYELMLEQYDISDENDNIITEDQLEIIEVYYFKTAEGIFDDYVNKWAKIKIEAGKEENKSRRAIAKLFMNSLYGKFGSKIRNSFKYFFIDDKNKLNSDSKVENVDEPLYTPVAAAITAGGRRMTIETSQKILDFGLKKYGKYVYCYSDTDSIHTTLCREDVIECLGDSADINETGELGLWDIEEDDIVKSQFIRTKTYLEERRDGTMKSGIAGLPSEIQECLIWESFDKGIVIIGKLSPIQVEGGTALIESTFEIK